MDDELILIFSFVFVVAVLALSMAQLFHRRAVAHEERKLELKAQIEQAKANRANSDSEAHRKLEERVRVLERIVTDGNHALASQIEDLRDLQQFDRLEQGNRIEQDRERAR